MESMHIEASTKRALLIGSPVGALTAPETDVSLMDDVLRNYGFTTARCFDKGKGQYPATRDGILNAWDDLIFQAAPTDAVLIYYTGHGGLTEKPDEDKDQMRRWRLQFLVPTDFFETSPGDFRGITDVEISNFLARLTKKTPNVIMILDCCHSARMARRPATPRAINPDDYPGVSAHIQSMFKDGKIGTDFFLEGNRDVVRVVAAATSDSAWERQFDGKCKGVLTEALAEALTYASSSQASWRDIMLRVRDRVSRTMPGQHVQVEGPMERLLFSTQREKSHVVFPVQRRNSDYVLVAGRLHGVSKGDQFTIQAPIKNSTIGESGLTVPSGEAVRVGVATSELEVRWVNEPTEIPEGAQATLVTKVLDRQPVSVLGDDEWVGLVTTYLESSDFLRPAEKSECNSALAKIAKEEPSRVTIYDTQGAMLRDWNLEGNKLEDLLNLAIAVLRKLARAHHVLSLQGDDALSQYIHVEFGAVQDGSIIPLCDAKSVLHPGNRVYIELRNNSPSQTLFVSIFDITGETATLLNDTSPDGIELRQDGGSYVFGEVDFTNQRIGSLIEWPADVPPNQTLSVAAILVITDRKIDLRGLNTERTREKRATDHLRECGLDRAETNFDCDLIGKVGLINSGAVRVLPASRDSHVPLRFGIKHIFYHLEGPK